MVSDDARKNAARAYAREHGISYTAALRAIARSGPSATTAPAWPAEQVAEQVRVLQKAHRHVDHARQAGVVLDEVPLAERGVGVLAPDAAPYRRARAEAIWRPVGAAEPCPCTGDCSHGRPCVIDADEDEPDRCAGRMVHVDRLPAGMFVPIEWEDTYVCDTCGNAAFSWAELSEVPWGEITEQTTVVYDGVRHPAVSEDGDGAGVIVGCDECGAAPGYRCHCV